MGIQSAFVNDANATSSNVMQGSAFVKITPYCYIVIIVISIDASI